jgi:acetyl esterase/lipase
MDPDGPVAVDTGARDAADRHNAQTYVYKSVDGLDLRADLYRPTASTSDPLPVVLWIHGGALVLGTRKDILLTRSHELARFLERGWIVVSIDYRLAPETKAPEIWEDVRDAFAWVRNTGPHEFGADANRIAAVGPSSGGYLSLLAGARLTPSPQVVVSWFGYGDMTGDWYTTPDSSLGDTEVESAEAAWAAVGSRPVAELPAGHVRRRFYNYARRQGLRGRLIGGDDLEPYCPALLVTPEFPPTLLIHGDADAAVPVEQSMQMAEALRANGVEHEKLIVPGVGHSFDREATSPEAQLAIDRSIAFLAQHLAQRPA